MERFLKQCGVKLSLSLLQIRLIQNIYFKCTNRCVQTEIRFAKPSIDSLVCITSSSDQYFRMDLLYHAPCFETVQISLHVILSWGITANPRYWSTFLREIPPLSDSIHRKFQGKIFSSIRVKMKICQKFWNTAINIRSFTVGMLWCSSTGKKLSPIRPWR